MLLTKLLKELTAAGIPVSDGIYITAEGVLGHHDAWTQEQETTAAQVIAAHDPTDYAALRRDAAPAELLQSQLAKATIAQADTWIDNNIKGTTVPEVLQAIRLGFKMLVRLIIPIRNYIMSEYLD